MFTRSLTLGNLMNPPRSLKRIIDRFQLTECRDYSYLIGSTLKTKTQNPVSSLSLETLMELVK
ncbi:hypothetical protein BSU04nite_26860 [Bacillus spizizenii]|nr:hypothetical protein BSU04nite_26860 [Bacillus spizizenii]